MPRKRVTTAPLTPEEIDAALNEIPEDEFIEQFEDIFARDAMPETLEELMSLDDYMERELREMFQSIVAQYLRPVEFAVGRVREGEQSRRTALEGLEALAPIITASETLEYADITALLREIESPLRDLESGAKRRLSKREVDALGKAWARLVALVRPGTQVREPEPKNVVALASLTRHVDGVSPSALKKLRTAGLSTLGEIAGASVDEIAQVTGLPVDVVARIRAFASGTVVAAASSTRPQRRAPKGIAQGWMRVSIESDVLRGQFSFEYATLGRYVEPLLSKLAESGEGVVVASSRPPAPKPARRRSKRTTDALGSER